MALTRPESSKNVNNSVDKGGKTKLAYDAENLPNQNSHQAMMYSLKQGAFGAAYGFLGSTAFSLLAHRFCKILQSFLTFNKHLVCSSCL
jgi:hypothetical protein